MAARDVIAAVDLPPFDNSGMDGYAVQAQDLHGAGPGHPVQLRIAGRVPAGSASDEPVTSGTCIRLFTGSPLPKGSDAVVMQEDTEPVPDNPEAVAFLSDVKPWENVRFRGEDLKRGAVLVQTGERLTPGKIAVLAACGFGSVFVGRAPIVSILSTGSELAEAGTPLAPGQIYESNRVVLASLAAEAGAKTRLLPLCADEPSLLASTLDQALAQSDVVITSGGVSVGEYDFVKSAFREIGGELELWKVAMKPGKPFMFGRRGEKMLFGVPGNPVSALVTFLILVRPALLHMQGAKQIDLPTTPGTLGQSLTNRGNRRHFVRVNVDANGIVRSAGIQASHILSSLINANGLVDIPPETTWEQGKTVRVLRWND